MREVEWGYFFLFGLLSAILLPIFVSTGVDQQNSLRTTHGNATFLITPHFQHLLISTTFSPMKLHLSFF